MVNQDKGLSLPILGDQACSVSSSPSENRRFNRWIAPVAIFAAVFLVIGGSLYHQRFQQPSPLPYHSPNPALLAKYRAVPAGWAGHPQWFLEGGQRPFRWQVNLTNGLFVHSQMDLYVNDAIPLVLTRTYMSLDKQSRAFGMGAMSSFDMYLQGDNRPFTYTEIILPVGDQLYYRRVTPGVGYSDALYLHRPGPTEDRNIYWGSTIRWDVNRWNLKLLDGTILNFPGSRYATRPEQAALIRVTDPAGDTLAIDRDAMGNVLKVTSPNGATIVFTHDAANRVTSARDSQGHLVTYAYDAKGYLAEVKSPQGITHYTYDRNGMMISVTKPDGTVWTENTYDGHGLLTSTHLYGKTTRYEYSTDTKGNVIGTRTTDPEGIVDEYTFDSSGIPTSHIRKKPGSL